MSQFRRNVRGTKASLWDSGGTTHCLLLLKFPPDTGSNLGLLLQWEKDGVLRECRHQRGTGKLRLRETNCLWRTSRADVGPCAVVPTQPGGGRAQRLGFLGGRIQANWKGCGTGVSAWVLTWLLARGSEFSSASSCWSLACAEPTSCWSSKNSVYWSWNTAA